MTIYDAWVNASKCEPGCNHTCDNHTIYYYNNYTLRTQTEREIDALKKYYFELNQTKNEILWECPDMLKRVTNFDINAISNSSNISACIGKLLPDEPMNL